MNVKKLIKKILGIEDFSLFQRKMIQRFESLFYHKKYTAQDILDVMISQGLKPGDTIVVHCAMNNFYNYRGSAEELIKIILDYLGDDGTLCMPGYPPQKENEKVVFDVRNDKTAAGYLAEVFRKMPGVKRSVCHEHAVCAIGRNADFLLSEHHLSKIRYDEHSPYYKLAEVNAKSFSLGLPKYYIGTVEHVSEALLFNKLRFFGDKFQIEKIFSYIDYDGELKHQTLLSGSKVPYVRKHNSELVERYFDKTKYSKIRLSNIWINMYDAKYTIDQLEKLARKGLTIYKYPKWYNK